MRRLILLLLPPLVWLSGCETEAPDPVEPSDPSPAAVAPAVEPPPLPPLAQIRINEQVHDFPRARLRVQQKDDEVLALLFSDDTGRREEEPQAGNSFYFEMRLDIDDLTKLDQAQWSWQAASLDRAESPNGIFLDGWRKHLQPMNVEAIFEPHPDLPDRLLVHLGGQFILFHTRDRGQAPVWVGVDSRLIVKPEVAK